jgi:3-oxoacyl-[acyl-carrier protein] reductase
MQKLAGKNALITGASRGIGRAIALALAKEGAAVAINYRSSASEAEQVVNEIVEMGGRAVALPADVAVYDDAQTLIKSTIEALGSLNILVNNAGTTRDKLLMQMKEDEWDTVVNTNLKGVYNCCKAAVRPMLRARAGGRIINISSVSGLTGQVGQTNYSASKAGIIGFSNALAKELGSRQVTVNTIAPGYVPTELSGTLSDEYKDAFLQMTPLGRFGSPEDIAAAVAFLASDDASYITGVCLRVDGGLAIGS